ncbi:MAG TPA: 2-dehydropantoate 2-reductase N-terminal domain-containing protein, partial [Pseudogracilibacillus sp.]|nr:2-dehydropantoate 2-reductase N-terminal domain-containing protein [Pseudogracilibacillus sp.]
MLALHFGAGNIGRGFIGHLLHEAGYRITFIDVNDTLIQELNEKKAYKVVLETEETQTLTVKNVSGINNQTHPEDVVEAIKQADLITTAVGPKVLPIISNLIANGLRARSRETNR